MRHSDLNEGVVFITSARRQRIYFASQGLLRFPFIFSMTGRPFFSKRVLPVSKNSMRAKFNLPSVQGTQNSLSDPRPFGSLRGDGHLLFVRGLVIER